MGDETPVQKFYAGGHIFITGGTGFLGKVLTEKLLRSCPGIEKIYLLIREKKNVDPVNRLKNLLSEKLFERLKSEDPNFAEKLEVVTGDCAEPYLGMSSAVREKLAEKVNIVFHSAATVRFDENLKKACAANVVGTERVIEFCRSLKNLKTIIHVSTVYSNCHLKKIEDIFHDPPLCHDRIEKLCDALTEYEIDILTPHLLQKWPNTYTFTKAIAETKIKLSAIDLPIGIFRPATVTASFAEPIPGWIDNINGPTGLFLQSWLGIMKVIQGDRNAISDIIPVDLTASALILVGKAIHDSYRTQPGEIKIYGFESNSINPVTWGEAQDEMIEWTKSFPSIHAVGLNYIFYSQSKTAYRILSTLLETIPGYFIDLFFKASGKRHRMMNMYKKIHSSMDGIGYFASTVMNYKSKNMEQVFDECTNEDKKLFSCDLKQIVWKEYSKNYLLGIREHIMKESEDTIEKAKVRQRNLFWMYVASRMILSVILVWIILAVTERINA